MNMNDDLLNKATVIAKLLYLQTKPRIEELKAQLLETPQQKKAYDTLDGKRTIKEIALVAGYSGTRSLETILPDWERKGLILGVGKGPNKKYVNIENLEV